MLTVFVVVFIALILAICAVLFIGELHSEEREFVLNGHD